MKINILLPVFTLLCGGCASQPGMTQRVALDSLATGAGGAAAYFASGHDPAITALGAIGGLAISEGAQALARNGREKAYNSGVEEGKAIGQQQVLHGLWEESNGLPRNRKTDLYPTLTVPFRIQNGVKYDAHSASSFTLQPEKILVPSQASTNAKSGTHYETFQNKE